VVPVKALKKVKPEAAKESFFTKAVEFVKEAKGELKKVVWPGRNQTMASTLMVVVLVFIISSFLGLVDFLLSGLMALILRS
jgi:preprotein translocase subunit SecE